MLDPSPCLESSGAGKILESVLTPEEAADYLRVDRETVYRRLRAGKLPGNKIGHQWRIGRADLDLFLLGKMRPLGAREGSAASPLPVVTIQPRPVQPGPREATSTPSPGLTVPVVAPAELLRVPPGLVVPQESEVAAYPPSPSGLEPEDEYLLALAQGGDQVGLRDWQRGHWPVKLQRVLPFKFVARDEGGKRLRLHKYRLMYLFDLKDRSLIKSARVLFQPVRDLKLEPHSNPRQRTPYETQLLDAAFADQRRRLTVTFLDGYQLSGRVTALSRFAFQLEFAPEARIWAYRHAIAVLELEAPRAQA